MHRGYIKDWRKSLDNPLYKKPLIWHFWGYCLKKANHKDNECFLNGQIIIVKKGSFVFGRKKASLETGLSERQIRTSLKHLQNLQNLTIKTTNKYSIISIINWDTYQQDELETTSKTTKERPANDQQTTTNKNDKNVKNEKNNNTSCPEPEKSGPGPEQKIEPESLPFLEIPLIKKDGMFVVLETHAIEWEESYPGINVRQELRNLQQWNKANPERRKTKTGILKHIVAWLSKAQNSAVPKINGKSFIRPNRSEQNLIECQNFIQGAPDAR